MKAIVDTGPWVALIDRSESKHLDSVHWLKQFSGTLYSTEAVLTEVLYLLNFSIKAQCAAIDFVVESLIELVPSDRKSLEKTKNLTLSSEEKETQKQKEIENRIKGMVQKYQDGILSKNQLTTDYELLKKDYNMPQNNLVNT